MTLSNETRLLRDIRDRLTAVMIAVWICALLLLAICAMVAVWFFRIENVRNTVKERLPPQTSRVIRPNFRDR